MVISGLLSHLFLFLDRDKKRGETLGANNSMASLLKIYLSRKEQAGRRRGRTNSAEHI